MSADQDEAPPRCNARALEEMEQAFVRVRQALFGTSRPRKFTLDDTFEVRLDRAVATRQELHELIPEPRVAPDKSV